jgi:hypothetical protein
VQAAATLPVHLFPVLDEQGRTHEEPFYTVMGFAPTDHGLGIIARVSQKQVVNVAQRGGLAAVLVGYRPEDLKSSTRLPVQADLATQELRALVQRLRDLDGVIHLLEWDEETYRPRDAAEDRASQLAVLGALRHDLLAGDRLGDCSRRSDSRRLERARGHRARATRPLAAHGRCAAAESGRRVRRDALALPRGLGGGAPHRRLRHVLESVRPVAEAHARARRGAEALRHAVRRPARRARARHAAHAARLAARKTGARLRALVPALAERTRQVTRSC